ncbi:hypothetical protein PV05_00855 [Exophiala xenobiotica]|uniref:Ketoreductase (KR) domain-containing protein n=1 Tax=Exophiala xenobiotica TaxID=348802 RepID=A0A0D2F137_9EURO|nr:uncharacterized protein PV05_00855 [Exophiala xenobiotica]KIW60655.1 hypothetical protein PV05_00855 [Exophiala xenobiotica]
MIATDTSPDAATHGQPVPPKGLTARDLFALDRRTIIVTGATGGMAIQVVSAILQCGADVIAVNREMVPSTLR